LTNGYLIFSQPVAGRRVAAVFSTDVEGGDGEVILLPPDRAERRSLATFIEAPNLDEHIRAAVLLFTGDVYERLMSQIAANPANRKAPEMAPLLDEQWGGVLRNLGTSYQVRLTLDLMVGPAHAEGLFAGMFRGTNLGAFDLLYDPDNAEQIMAGQLSTRNNRLFFDTWTSFPARSARQHPTPLVHDPQLADYRIDATVAPDLTLSAISRIKVGVKAASLAAVPFDIARDMSVTEVRVDGVPAEVLQAESARFNLARGGNDLFLVVPQEPLRAGREYEFEFRHSGKVIHEAGDHIYYVTSRGNWYPANGHGFSNYDLTFHFPRGLDLVSAGDTVDDRTEGDMRVVHRRTSSPVRIVGFNLGDYLHAKVERGGYVVDVCANRRLEPALQPRAPDINPPVLPSIGNLSRRRPDPLEPIPPIERRIPSPVENLQALAGEIASAMEFMASRFGPPALPHLTVSPIPGAFGQGFPGLIYLSTLAYLKSIPGNQTGNAAASAELFFQDVDALPQGFHLGHGGFLGHSALVGFHLGRHARVFFGQLRQRCRLGLVSRLFDFPMKARHALLFGAHLLRRDVRHAFDFLEFLEVDAGVAGLLFVGQEAFAQDAERRRDAVKLEVVLLSGRQGLAVVIQRVVGQAEEDATVAIVKDLSVGAALLGEDERREVVAEVDDGVARALGRLGIDPALLAVVDHQGLLFRGGGRLGDGAWSGRSG